MRKVLDTVQILVPVTECPKEISIEYIRKMNLDYNLSNIKG